MRIGKPLALIVGLVSLWPAIYMLLFLGFFVWTAFTILNRQPQNPGLLPYIVIPHIGTMLVMFALMSFYIVHVFKNAALKDDRRVLWAVVLFLGSPVSAPIYWYFYVWPTARRGAGPTVRSS